MARTPPAASLRILLVDDHEVVRRGLRTVLAARAGWEVCGEVADGREALRLAIECRPKVVVLDLMLRGLNGVEVTRRIRQALPETEVLAFSVHDSEHVVQEALDAGARGYVLKSDAVREVVAAVDALANHRAYFSPGAAQAAGRLTSRSPVVTYGFGPRRLTAREREIVQLLAEGQGNKQIAWELSISVKTVETHRAAVMRKLDLASFAELVRYAVRQGITRA